MPKTSKLATIVQQIIYCSYQATSASSLQATAQHANLNDLLAHQAATSQVQQTVLTQAQPSFANLPKTCVLHAPASQGQTTGLKS